jgi:hypothetical protein
MLKLGSHLSNRISQRYPKLHRVKSLGIGKGKFTVRDASTRGHQIQLTWLDVLDGADTVSVFESAFNHPRSCLKSGMWVRGNHHAFILLRWAEVVGKRPSANHALSRVRKRSTNLDSCSGREFHISWLEQHF